MDLQIKLFRWPDRGNHVIIIARGSINALGFEQMFSKIAEMIRTLPDCKVLIDLLDAILTLELADVDALARALGPELMSPTSKMALVAAQDIEQYDRLCALAAGLFKRGLKVAAFYDSKVAIDWLADNV
jgi:hypothetical protein